MLFDRAAVQHRTMAYRDVIFQNQWTFVPHHVADGAILYVGVTADANDVDITANHAVVPNTGVIADLNIAYDLSAIGNVHTLSDLRPLSLVFMQH